LERVCGGRRRTGEGKSASAALRFLGWGEAELAACGFRYRWRRDERGRERGGGGLLGATGDLGPGSWELGWGFLSLEIIIMHLALGPDILNHPIRSTSHIHIFDDMTPNK
jgi:hypothetical protein